MRATPNRVAGLVPPVVALAGGGGAAGFLGRLLEAVQERWAGLGDAPAPRPPPSATSAVVLAGAKRLQRGSGSGAPDAPGLPAVTKAAESGRTAFALDLRDVSFFDSQGLMALLTVQKQAEVSDWDGAFVKPAGTHIWNLFELAALTTCLAFFDSPTAALIAVASSTDAQPQ